MGQADVNRIVDEFVEAQWKNTRKQYGGWAEMKKLEAKEDKTKKGEAKKDDVKKGGE